MELKSSRMILFQRVELKYLVDRTRQTALEKDLRAFIPPDKYTAETGGYLIRSIYYDTPDYMCYHDKMTGVARRHKLRVRVYGEEPEKAPFVRLEIKSRYNATIHKITVDVPMADYPEVEACLHGNRMLPEKYMRNPEISKEFVRIQRQYNMQPQILVQYRRRAYEKIEMSRVRINFDYELIGSKNLDLFGPLKGAHPVLKYGTAILEIKVDGAMPFWVHRLIGKYDLQNEAISKYCYAVRGQARTSPVARPHEPW